MAAGWHSLRRGGASDVGGFGFDEVASTDACAKPGDLLWKNDRYRHCRLPSQPSAVGAVSYQGPVFSWVPSIAVSNLIGAERGLSPEWQGDPLIASLKARTLFRPHLRGDRVAYVEPIYIGSGIRDLIAGTTAASSCRAMHRLPFLDLGKR